MGVVRREGGWRLEKQKEGLYEVTYQGDPEANVVTPEYSAGMMDEVGMSLIPVHRVNSYAEAEGIFEEYAHGGPPSGMPSVDIGNSGFGSGVNREARSNSGLGGSRRNDDGDLLEDLEDLPPGGLALVCLLVSGVLLYNTGFAPGQLVFLVGIAIGGLGIAIFAWAGILLQTTGWGEAVEFLISVEESSSNSATSQGKSNEPKKTPPAPEKLKNELIFGRANQACEWCNAKPLDNPEVHHIEPRKDGGPNKPKNLIVLCPTCHSKADRGGISKTKLKGKMRHLRSEQS